MSLFVVTGGAGFIGSHLVDALVARGDRVRVLDDLSTGRRENLAAHAVGEPGSGAPVELVRGDVRDPRAARQACEGAAGVFHEAAQVSVPRSIEDPLESYAVNVTGTLVVLEAARRAGVRRFVFAASSAAYGDSAELPKHEGLPARPQSPYASGKLAGEEMLAVWGRVHGMRTVSLRYFNVFGPRQLDDSPYTGVIAIFARALLEGRPVQIHGDGEQTRDFTYVANAVEANLLAMEAELEPGAVFNVGTGERLTILGLYREMARILGVERAPEFAPARAGDVRHSLASLERIRGGLGYEPRVDLRAGLTSTLEWYRTRLVFKGEPD
jgi:nucleoside-diphosphate-sugar epimerase